MCGLFFYAHLVLVFYLVGVVIDELRYGGHALVRADPRRIILRQIVDIGCAPRFVDRVLHGSFNAGIRLAVSRSDNGA